MNREAFDACMAAARSAVQAAAAVMGGGYWELQASKPVTKWVYDTEGACGYRLVEVVHPE